MNPGAPRLEASLLEASDARIALSSTPLLELGSWRAEGRGACLVGDFDPLVRWLLGEGELAGRLTIGGLDPHLALRRGVLGLALAAPRWEPTWTTEELLRASASLVGASVAQVRRALERTRLARHRGVPIGRLNSVQRRLLALTCASVTEPAVILFERPFAGLNDDAAQFLETVLAELTAGCSWLALVDVTTPWERRLCERADAGVFVARGTRALGPFAGAEWLEGPRVFWVHVAGTEAAEALRTQGGQVDPGPAPDTLIVRGLSGLHIVQALAQGGARLRELVPLSQAASCY